MAAKSKSAPAKGAERKAGRANKAVAKVADDEAVAKKLLAVLMAQ